MAAEDRSAVQDFLRCQFALLLLIPLLRVFEYCAVAQRLFVAHPAGYEAIGLLYDTWLWAIWSVACFLPFWALHRLTPRLALPIQHLLNCALLIVLLALLLTFSQRNAPFDHEFFTRSTRESWETVKQMATTGWLVFLPFVICLPLYFGLYFYGLRKRTIRPRLRLVTGLVSVLLAGLFSFAQPDAAWFPQHSAWYLSCNKLSYFVQDSYRFLRRPKEAPISDAALRQAVAFYQAQQPFHFTNPQWPLLHRSDEPDVLGPFFHLQSTPPNIVLLVVEGLSSDFSGRNAYAASFTPFLDSLSDHSLVWENFLSTAPGTFAAQPAVAGSVPYADKGFAVQSVLPEHLSITRLLHANGYYTQFFAGFNTDFDNMGGFIRAQGTDLVLSRFGPKYREMGVGSEGWSMGYPDDALFSRSFEVLDSVRSTPYFSIYHTGTTHMPYLFEQKPQYDRCFDDYLRRLSVTPAIRHTLRQSKEVLVTFLFSDDCLRNFFARYSQRPEWSNTIFLITGDHHIGSFPSTGSIDDYHVPFIVYSPMLKAPQRFRSVNSHNQIAPTLAQLLTRNYPVRWNPAEVPWMGAVLDTATNFRNVHRMAFMAWSRSINDYIDGTHFLSEGELYRLTPTLQMEPERNDSLKTRLAAELDNFRQVNRYVCERNRIFPPDLQALPGKRTLLLDWSDSSVHRYFTQSPDTSLAPDLRLPVPYKYLYVEAEAEAYQDAGTPDDHPTFRFSLIDNRNGGRDYLYWSKRDVVTLSAEAFRPRQWNPVQMKDLFPMGDFRSVQQLLFEWAIYTDEQPMNLQLRRKHLRVYGVAP